MLVKSFWKISRMLLPVLRRTRHLLIQVTGIRRGSMPQPLVCQARRSWNIRSACCLMPLIAAPARRHDRCTSHSPRGPVPCVRLRIVEQANSVRCAVAPVKRGIPHHSFPEGRSAACAHWLTAGKPVTVVPVARICLTRRLIFELKGVFSTFCNTCTRTRPHFTAEKAEQHQSLSQS